MGDNFCLDRDEIKIWWTEFIGHFCNFYYYQVIWRTSPVTWRHWGRPFSQQCRGSWTGSTRSAWPPPTRPLSSARWTSSIIFIEKFVKENCYPSFKKRHWWSTLFTPGVQLGSPAQDWGVVQGHREERLDLGQAPLLVCETEGWF